MGPEGWGGGGAKISRFVFPSPATISFFFCLPGFHTTARELQGPGLQKHTTKIPRKIPRESEKNEMEAGEEKKGDLAQGGPGESKPTTATTTITTTTPTPPEMEGGSQPRRSVREVWTS